MSEKPAKITSVISGIDSSDIPEAVKDTQENVGTQILKHREPIMEKFDSNPASVSRGIDSAINNLEDVKTNGIWLTASLLIICWLALVLTCGIVIFGWPLNMSRISTLTWLSFGALSLFPAAIILCTAYIMAKLAAMAQQSRSLIAATDIMTRPDDLMKERAGSLAASIRSQVLNVDGEMKSALERLSSMELTLKSHTDALSNSHIAATRQTGEITQRLAEERDGLKSMSESFDERMGALSRMMSEHSDRLAQSTHMAEQKIQEARVSVEGAAAKINASSEIVRANALDASESLSSSEGLMRDLADQVQAQARAIDDINSRHALQMNTLVRQLKAEQKELSNSIEERLEKMRDMSLSAQVSAQSLDEASAAGRETVEALAQSASLADEAVKQHFSQMQNMVAFSSAKAESIGERAAKRVRDSLSLTRMEISRIENDMLALETKATQNLSPDNQVPVDITPQRNSSKLGWRKSLLRLKPVEESSLATKSSLNLVPLVENEPEAQALETLQDNTSDPAENIPLSERLAPPQQDPTPSPALNIQPDQLSAAVDSQSPAAEQNLDLEISHDTDFSIPDPDAGLKQAAQDIVTPALTEAPIRKKIKRGWSWKTMLGGMKNETSDADYIPDDQNIKHSSSLRQPANLKDSGAFISAQLSKIGLSPNAVIDDGCIIECVNTGRAKGINTMQNIVALRLTGPIHHLREQLATDRDLAAHMQAYASDFSASLHPYQNDREALRTLLESENGRAFLLCEAALNNSRDHS